MTAPGPQVLAFVVKAGVEGKKKPQPISQRFASQVAAADYCELAKKNGFRDAFVTSIEGYEKDPMNLKVRAKVTPPIA